MPDTNPNTEQQETEKNPIASIAEATPVKETQPPAEPEEDPEDDAVEGEEGEEVPRTEFMNLKDALVMGRKQLQSKHFGNAANLRQFLIMDLYPILIEITDFANWYVGDLHNRVMGLEMGEGGESGEGLDPETAEQLINFIGMSLQIFGVILQSPKADPKLLQVAQVLTAQAPGLIAKVQEITMSDEPDEDDEDYEGDEDYDEDDENDEGGEMEDEPNAEPTAVLEPRGREPVQATPAESEEPKAEVQDAESPVSSGEPTTSETVSTEVEQAVEESPSSEEEAVSEEASRDEGEKERSDG